MICDSIWQLDLLTGSQLSVEEIANKTGFAGTQSFSKAFKKARGQSPLNFRKASSHLGTGAVKVTFG